MLDGSFSRRESLCAFLFAYLDPVHLLNRVIRGARKLVHNDGRPTCPFRWSQRLLNTTFVIARCVRDTPTVFLSVHGWFVHNLKKNRDEKNDKTRRRQTSKQKATQHSHRVANQPIPTLGFPKQHLHHEMSSSTMLSFDTIVPVFGTGVSTVTAAVHAKKTSREESTTTTGLATNNEGPTRQFTLSCKAAVAIIFLTLGSILGDGPHNPQTVFVGMVHGLVGSAVWCTTHSD